MVGFALLPPEVNSAQMFGGPGAVWLLTIAATYKTLAEQLTLLDSSFAPVVSTMLAGWSGPAATTMNEVAAWQAQWLRETAAGAEQTAENALRAAGLHGMARSMAVHPAVVAANRAQQRVLAMANIFGHNAATIATLEAEYGHMWAVDVAAMTVYQDGMAALASTLKLFSPPTSDEPVVQPWGPAVSSGRGTPAGGVGSLLSLLGMVLVSTGVEAARSADAMMIALLLSLGQIGAGDAVAIAAAGGAGLAASVPAWAAGVIGATHLLGAVSAGLGKSNAVGLMSVPQSWAMAAPAAATHSAHSALTPLPEQRPHAL